MLWLHMLGWFQPSQFLHSTATKCYGYTYLGGLNLHSSYTVQPQNVMVTHTWVIWTFTVPTQDSHKMLWLHTLGWYQPSQFLQRTATECYGYTCFGDLNFHSTATRMLWLHILGWFETSQFQHSTATKCYGYTYLGDINLHSSYTVQPPNVIVTHALVIWTSIYLALQPFDCDRVQWRLFQRVVRTKFCIYVLF